MAKRILLPVGVLTLLILACWWLWYNSSQQKLQRCVKAESDYYFSTTEGQELHRQGTDPPISLFVLECNQLGIR